MSGSALRSAMINHVTQVATHYKGKIYAWDVVNEAFADGGSGARRDSNLQRTGNDWIEAAFRAARAADPGAKLCYNDYNTDGVNAKTHRRLQHGPGLQVPRRADRLRRLPVALQQRSPCPSTTRPTCSASPTSASTCRSPSWTSRAPAAPRPTPTADVVTACLAVARCTGITVWGIRDSDSWRASGNPLLFDGSGNKKAGYTVGPQRAQRPARRRPPPPADQHPPTTARRPARPPQHAAADPGRPAAPRRSPSTSGTAASSPPSGSPPAPRRSTAGP